MWSSLVPSCSDRWMHAAGKGTCAGDGNGDRALGPVAYTRLFTFLFRTEASGTWKARNHLLVEENLWRTGKSGTFWLLRPITLILKDHYQSFFCVCVNVYTCMFSFCACTCVHMLCAWVNLMCAGMYTHLCACLYVYMLYAYTHEAVYMYVYSHAICMYRYEILCMHLCACLFTCYVHTFVCVLCTCKHVHVCMCMSVCTHMCMRLDTSADFTLCCSSSVPCAHSLSL